MVSALQGLENRRFGSATGLLEPNTALIRFGCPIATSVATWPGAPEAYLLTPHCVQSGLARDPSQRTDAELHNVLQTVGLGDWVATAPREPDLDWVPQDILFREDNASVLPLPEPSGERSRCTPG